MNKPNFLIFMADQLRFDYLGCNGHKIIKTPNIDQIASEGTNFSKFYDITETILIKTPLHLLKY